MKLSNLALATVASSLLGVAVGATVMTTPTTPTVVISIPAADGTSGGGFVTSLPKNLTPKQAQMLSLAYEIAKKDGHKYPQLLQGILLQETKAGGMSSYAVAGQEFGLKTNERYYGVAQIKLVAARAVLNHYPSLKQEFDFHTQTDEEVIAKLIENDRFNISVASKYLLILKQSGYDTMKTLAVAYNQGAAGAARLNPDRNQYSRGVMAHIQDLTLKE